MTTRSDSITSGMQRKPTRSGSARNSAGISESETLRPERLMQRPRRQATSRPRRRMRDQPKYAALSKAGQIEAGAVTPPNEPVFEDLTGKLTSSMTGAGVSETYARPNKTSTAGGRVAKAGIKTAPANTTVQRESLARTSFSRARVMATPTTSESASDRTAASAIHNMKSLMFICDSLSLSQSFSPAVVAPLRSRCRCQRDQRAAAQPIRRRAGPESSGPPWQRHAAWVVRLGKRRFYRQLGAKRIPSPLTAGAPCEQWNLSGRDRVLRGTARR
jgi:hypothetical protein